MPKCASNNRDVFLNFTLPACFRVCLLFGCPFSPPPHAFSNSLCCCNTAGPPCPRETKQLPAKPRAAKPAKTKKSRHIVTTRLTPVFVHFFKQHYTIFGTIILQRNMVPIKALFLDNSFCVRHPSKARAQGHAFLIGACAWHAPCVLSNYV